MREIAAPDGSLCTRCQATRRLYGAPGSGPSTTATVQVYPRPLRRESATRNDELRRANGHLDVQRFASANSSRRRGTRSSTAAGPFTEPSMCRPLAFPSALGKAKSGIIWDS